MKLQSIITTLCWWSLLTLLGLTTHAQTWRVETYGCLAGRSSTVNLPQNQVSVRTGVAALDDTIMEDLTALDTSFGVTVPVYFLKNQVANAFFTPAKFPELIQADGRDPAMQVTGSVFLSMALLDKEFRETNGSLMSIPAILGHEFAHAMQHSRQNPLQGKWRELHADMMAGWFIGLRGQFRPQNVQQAGLSLYRKGDYNFFDAGHHGTPEERAEAFAVGYWLHVNQGVTDASIAYTRGVEALQWQAAQARRRR